MKKLLSLFLLLALAALPAAAQTTNAKLPITAWNTASASAAMEANKQYKYTLTADLTATSFSGSAASTEGSTIRVALLGCSGTHTFNFPASKRIGDADATSTSLTPAAGNHLVVFQRVGSAWYYTDSVFSLNPALTTIELGHASDTTVSRAAAGQMAVEGVAVVTVSSTDNLSNKSVTGALTLNENASVAMDPAGSADGKYTGITVTGTGGDTIAFGDLVTLDKDDSRWEKVDVSVAAAATGDARGVLGIAVTSSTDGGAITVLLCGIVRADANFPSLTIGAPVYATTSGDITSTQPTTTDHVIRIIGYALTADEIFFFPAGVWTTHT